MKKAKVSIQQVLSYDGEKIRQALIKNLDFLGGLERILRLNSIVFVKPNIVCWNSSGVIPKWGVVTTSRVVEDVITLLKDHGVNKIICYMLKNSM